MAKQPKLRVDDFPQEGTVFLAPTTDGRISAGRVLKREVQAKSPLALIAATPWLSHELPALESPVLRETLMLNHHSWDNHKEQFWVSELMPSHFRVLGRIELTAEDLTASSNSYGGWNSVPHQALLQWRWDHDREALLIDMAQEESNRSEETRKQAAIRDRYLKTLTLDSLVDKNWFESWEEEDVPIADASIKESRSILRKLVNDFADTPKLTSAVAKRLLKQSVEEFNQLNSTFQFIFTLEREDICDAYEQIMCAAKFPTLVDQIENWREW